MGLFKYPARSLCVCAAFSLIQHSAAAQHIGSAPCASGCCTAPVDALAPYEQFPDGQEPPAQNMVPSQLAEEQFASLGGDTSVIAQSNVGYIDSAIIATSSACGSTPHMA